MQAFTQRWADGKDIYSLLKASHWDIKFKMLHYQPSAQNNSWRCIVKVPIFSDIYSHSATFNLQLIQAIRNQVLHSGEQLGPPPPPSARWIVLWWLTLHNCFRRVNEDWLIWLKQKGASGWQCGIRSLPALCELIRDCHTGNPVHDILLLLPVTAQASPAHPYISNLSLLHCLCVHPSYWMSFRRAIQEPVPHQGGSRHFPSMRCNEMIKYQVYYCIPLDVNFQMGKAWTQDSLFQLHYHPKTDYSFLTTELSKLHILKHM